MLGQVSTAPVVMLKNGHRIRTRFAAPVPCALIPAPAVLAAVQAMGAQAAVPSPWTAIDFDMVSDWSGCKINVSATWSARDTVIDPELTQLPGIGALPVEQVFDETSGVVLYDSSRQERPTPPGPAPAPPPRGSGPPSSRSSTESSTGMSDGAKFVIGAGALAAAVWFLARRR